MRAPPWPAGFWKANVVELTARIEMNRTINLRIVLTLFFAVASWVDRAVLLPDGEQRRVQDADCHRARKNVLAVRAYHSTYLLRRRLHLCAGCSSSCSRN